MNVKKPKYSPSFSFGNVATIVCGVVFALGVVSTLQSNQAAAKQERAALKERIITNEKAFEQIIIIREDMIRIRANQENILRLLKKKENVKLEREKSSNV